MTEKPILFKGDMVRAILDGKKTQTRRVIKRSKKAGAALVLGNYYAGDRWWVGEHPHGGWFGVDNPEGPGELLQKLVTRDSRSQGFTCPYGQVGDRLWVRETWQYYDWTEDEGIPYLRYKADGTILIREDIPDEWQDRVEDTWEALSDTQNYNRDNRACDWTWRPSIHMPRWASRINLELTEVRAERLQDTTYDDILSEGYQQLVPRYGVEALEATDDWFRQLWDSINAKRGYSWDVNPWVYVLGIKRVS